MKELIYILGTVCIFEFLAIIYLICELSEIIGQRKIHNEKYKEMEQELNDVRSRKNQKRINGRFAK